MKQRYFPALIGVGPPLKESITTGLANVNMNHASHKRGELIAKKLDINNYSMIDKT